MRREWSSNSLNLYIVDIVSGCRPAWLDWFRTSPLIQRQEQVLHLKFCSIRSRGKSSYECAVYKKRSPQIPFPSPETTFKCGSRPHPFAEDATSQGVTILRPRSSAYRIRTASSTSFQGSTQADPCPFTQAPAFNTGTSGLMDIGTVIPPDTTAPRVLPPSGLFQLGCGIVQ